MIARETTLNVSTKADSFEFNTPYCLDQFLAHDTMKEFTDSNGVPLVGSAIVGESTVGGGAAGGKFIPFHAVNVITKTQETSVVPDPEDDVCKAEEGGDVPDCEDGDFDVILANLMHDDETVSITNGEEVPDSFVKSVLTVRNGESYSKFNITSSNPNLVSIEYSDSESEEYGIYAEATITTHFTTPGQEATIKVVIGNCKYTFKLVAPCFRIKVGVAEYEGRLRGYYGIGVYFGIVNLNDEPLESQFNNVPSFASIESYEGSPDYFNYQLSILTQGSTEGTVDIVSNGCEMTVPLISV